MPLFVIKFRATLCILILSCVKCSLQASCNVNTQKYIIINGYSRFVVYYNCSNVTKDTFPNLFKTSCYYGGFISIDVKNTQLNLLNRELFLIDSFCNVKVDELILSNIHIQSLGENVFNTSDMSWNEIQKLNISHNELVSVRAQDFKLLQLQILDFSFNNLSSLGNLSYNLPSLKEFYLNNNNISAIQQDIFEKLTNLRILNLAYNKINSLNSHSFTNLEKLEKLYLSNNLLKCLRERPFQYLNNLNVIHLENNNLTFPDEKIFLGLNKLIGMYLLNNTVLKLSQNTLLGLKSIQTLEIFSSLSSKLSDFEYNSIGMNTDTITELGTRTFDGLDSLNKLKLADFNIGKINNGCFNDLKILQYLYFQNVTIRRIESESFVNVTALKNVSSCSRIDISYDFCNLSLQYIGPNVLLQLTYYAQRYKNQYFAIRLDNNNLTVLLNNTFSEISSITLIRLDSNNIREIESNAFGNLVFNKNPFRVTPDSKRTQYNSIYLNKNKIEKIHKETFSKIRNIVELRLDRNKISEIDLRAFNGLAFHPRLEERQRKNILHLNENRLKYISKEIFSNITHLFVLKLDINEIEHIEIKSFINLQTLVHLDVSYNSLVDIDAYTFMGLENLEILNLTNNKLSNLNHDSFFGLNSLQHLLLTENQIQNIPVGTFQNSPSLKNLQLGNNHISDFKVGSFSNLNKLQFLNLSHNRFFAINEVVLFPLQALALLDLDNNYLSHMNYSSLTLHLPTMRYISVNNNNWTCSFLTQMLKRFRDRGINYVFNSTAKYKRENVYGIECQEVGQYDEQRKPNGLIPFKVEDGNKDLLKNMSDILNHIKKETNLVSTSNSEILRQLKISKQIFEDIKSNTFDMVGTLHSNSNSSKFPRDEDNSVSSNLLSIIVVILLLCIVILLSLRFYKTIVNDFKCNRKNKNISEVELLEKEI